MKKKEKKSSEILDELFARYPQLVPCKNDFEKAYECLKNSYKSGGKLLVAGNGGSAADSEHIVGELMKSFLFNRKINAEFESSLICQFGNDGAQLAEQLEGTLTAFANDVDAAVSFAQMLYGYANKEDVFMGISTSGNSKNIIYAFMVAKAKGITSIALTGSTGGKCRELADIVICVPESETFKIQELHLPIYHALCSMLEADFFEER